MTARHDAALAAAEAALAIEAIPEVEGGVAHHRRAAAGARDPDRRRREGGAGGGPPPPGGRAAGANARPSRSSELAAERRGCELEETPVMATEPVLFDAGGVRGARRLRRGRRGAGEPRERRPHDAAGSPG